MSPSNLAGPWGAHGRSNRPSGCLHQPPIPPLAWRLGRGQAPSARGSASRSEPSAVGRPGRTLGTSVSPRAGPHGRRRWRRQGRRHGRRRDAGRRRASAQGVHEQCRNHCTPVCKHGGRCQGRRYREWAWLTVCSLEHDGLRSRAGTIWGCDGASIGQDQHQFKSTSIDAEFRSLPRIPARCQGYHGRLVGRVHLG